MILEFLLKGVDLGIFSKSQPKDLGLGLKERILVSPIFRRIFKVQLANLEYCVNTLPFSDGSKFFGRIGFYRQIEGGSLFIRGWLFNPDSRITGLTIMCNQNRYPILTYRLSRLDVFNQLGFLPNSLHCGFVGILEGGSINLDDVDFGFEATTDNAKVTGSFEPPVL